MVPGEIQTRVAAHGQEGNSREARIAWASGLVKRPIASFRELTCSEASYLIDGLQGQLGVKAPNQSRPDRAQSRRAGLDGRADGAEFQSAPQMATAGDLARIQRLLERMGWTQERLRLFLESPRSPMARKRDKTIRTTADANKVWWALKRIAQRQGDWEERRTA
jgi:hypothetical protein